MSSLAVGTNSGVPLWLWAAMLLACDPGCATRVVPPDHPDNAATVFVTDYGRHSSILLPTPEGYTVEYAFGDWDYFALSSYRWYKGALALCWSEQSTLGRRFIPLPPNESLLQERLQAPRMIALRADSAAVATLREQLDKRFRDHLSTIVYNGGHQMYFVKDDEPYGLFNNCNTVTANWLRDLGCDVQGFAMLSNFVLDSADHWAPTPPPIPKTPARDAIPPSIGAVGTGG